MKLTSAPLWLGLVTACASAPAAPTTPPAAERVPARAASGRPELRYYEISDA